MIDGSSPAHVKVDENYLNRVPDSQTILRFILRKFSDLRPSYDNELIHETFTTFLAHGL